jgi:hypothetical protein
MPSVEMEQRPRVQGCTVRRTLVTDLDCPAVPIAQKRQELWNLGMTWASHIILP